jgi:hypothetical protein
MDPRIALLKPNTEISRATPRRKRNEPFNDTIEDRYDAADDMQAGATLLSASTITGDEVCNMQDEKLGKIQDIMLDMRRARYVTQCWRRAVFWAWVIACSLFRGRP